MGSKRKFQRTIYVSGFAKTLAPNWRVGYLLAPGALFHAVREPGSLMRINFATTQDAQFWAVFGMFRAEQG